MIGIRRELPIVRKSRWLGSKIFSCFPGDHTRSTATIRTCFITSAMVPFHNSRVLVDSSFLPLAFFNKNSFAKLGDVTVCELKVLKLAFFEGIANNEGEEKRINRERDVT